MMSHEETTRVPSHWLSVTIALGMSAFVLVDDSSDQAGYGSNPVDLKGLKVW